MKKQEKKIVSPGEEKYMEGVGRRKTAVARVRVVDGKGNILVNQKPLKDYFPTARFQDSVTAPLRVLNVKEKHDVSVVVKGGGPSAQAGAVRHGLGRALAAAYPESKKQLRQFGFLTRDPRMVERKKYGLKKARRAPQWAKR